MRNLNKGQQPDVLKNNEETWLKDIEETEKLGEKPTKTQLGRYNHPDVKAALLSETYEKCAYCESKLRHISYGDIEHVVSKDKSPQLRFNWDNLTIACDVCNTKKSSKLGILDPYRDKPEEQLFFTGPTIFAREGHDAALYTELTMELNRIQLVERRVKVIERIISLVRTAKKIVDPTIRQALIDDIKTNECRDDVEYAVMARTYVRAIIAEGEIA